MRNISYLLVLWEGDNSVSVVSRNSKSVISTDGSDISFKWPRKGIFKGKTISPSGNTLLFTIFSLLTKLSYALYSLLGEDSKKEMEQRAKEMVMCEDKDEEESTSSTHNSTSNG